MRVFLSLTLALPAFALLACGQAESPAAPAPVASPPPAAAPSPSAPPVATGPNSAPSISGDGVCISPLNEAHIFDLEMKDDEGDAIVWTAQKRESQGILQQAGGGPVPSGTVVKVVYAPPKDQRDENWIEVTATDTRGASTTKHLYVKNH